MSLYGVVDKMKGTSTEKDETRLTISVGRVVDTNDPNQMGRIRVYIPGLDRDTANVGDIPFAMYCSPLAGHGHVQTRGPTEELTNGPVAYGMFNIPKVGTDVLIAHLNGNAQYRIWFGSLFGMFLTDTLPHGRFTFNNPDNPGVLDGPLSATEEPIQPIYNNLTGAFTRTTAVASNDGATDTQPRVNFEYRSRGMDYQASGLGLSQKNSPDQQISSIPDDRNFVFTEEDGTEFKQGDFTQGYALSQIEPDVPYDPSLVDGGQNLDPSTYSWTTPGFHSIAMDDRAENCRMRLRTTTGHTIIMDDTNERIYIATANGNNWIEMDQDGSIDVYSSKRVSVHAESDINFTTEGSFRVNAAQGIHMTSGADVRVTTAGNVEVDTTGDNNIVASGDTTIQSTGSINLIAQTTLNLTSTTDTNIFTGGQGAWTVDTNGTTLNFLTLAPDSAIVLTGPSVDVNQAPAAEATQLEPITGKDAYFTNRVPEHEPWGRIMMKQSSTDVDSGAQYELELDYDSPQVGREELGVEIPRNPKWHR